MRFVTANRHPSLRITFWRRGASVRRSVHRGRVGWETFTVKEGRVRGTPWRRTGHSRAMRRRARACAAAAAAAVTAALHPCAPRGAAAALFVELPYAEAAYDADPAVTVSCQVLARRGSVAAGELFPQLGTVIDAWYADQQLLDNDDTWVGGA